MYTYYKRIVDYFVLRKLLRRLRENPRVSQPMASEACLRLVEVKRPISSARTLLQHILEKDRI